MPITSHTPLLRPRKVLFKDGGFEVIYNVIKSEDLADQFLVTEINLETGLETIWVYSKDKAKSCTLLNEEQ